MNAGSRLEQESSRIDRYDFDRLEQSVEFLIKEHERLSGEREELLAELVDREHRISTLESRIDLLQNKRAVAVEGVDKIIARLEQLQVSVTAAAKVAS
jgi:chromosome segregation ATPase